MANPYRVHGGKNQEKRVKRRSFLKGLAIGAIGGGAGGFAINQWDVVTEAVPAVSVGGESTDAPWDNRVGKAGFEGWSLIDAGLGIRVWLAPNHDIGTILLYHEYDELGDSPLWAIGDATFTPGEIPRYDGSIDVPVVASIEQTGERFPTRRFQLMAAEGIFTTMSVIGRFYFELPADAGRAIVADA